MKRMKNVVTAVVVGLFAMCWCTASAATYYTWTNENGVVWRYTISNGAASVGGGSFRIPAIPRSTQGDIVIPATLGGFPVKTIAQCAFQDCKRITSLEIPDSVTSIKQSAFADCISLRKLRFGSGISAINYSDYGSQMNFAHFYDADGNYYESYNVFYNPFQGCGSLVGIEFGTNTLSVLRLNNFNAAKGLGYMYFGGALPASVTDNSIPPTMPGMSGRACYVSRDAYPDGLPATTWAGVPLRYLDGKLPSEDECWDLKFYTPSGWPKSFFLSADADSLVSKTKFFEGNPIYAFVAYTDLWRFRDIAAYTNSLHVSGSDAVWMFGMTNGQHKASWSGATNTDKLPANLQNLAPGQYTATIVLNDPCLIRETNYANNTNSITFTVVQSTEVSFVSEGNVVKTELFETGGTYEILPDAPVRQSYDFLGWFTEEEGGNVVTGTSTVPDSPVTLYAHWTFRPSRTITVSGSISASTTWQTGDLYIVDNNVTIASGVTLTIQPGVIVKFKAGKSLTVNSGGTVKAAGTRVLPIVFTSINDDANGGKTDGSNSNPQPGDWGNITVVGTIDLEHASILYAGGGADDGALTIGNNGTSSIENSVIAHGMYDGIRHRGNVNCQNLAIYDCDRGVNSSGGSGVFVNCVIDNCRWGAMAEGGSGTYRNCVVTRFFGSGRWPTGYGFSLWAGGSLSVKSCNVWSDSASSQNFLRYSGTDCLSTDPKFINAERGDFRIAANSPCVDAGDGAVAPEKDYYGSPRMNVTGVRPTGSASANGAVPDLGIYEVLGDGNVPSADLTVTAVTVPESLTVGEEVEVSWTVKNVGEETASGMWRDEIEIVAANGQTFPMGTVVTQAEIKPDATVNFKATVTVPAAPEGAVQVRVAANKYQDLFEAMRSENNVGSTTATLSVPTLAVPADGTATTVTLGGDSDYGFAVASSADLSLQGGVLVIRGAGEMDVWLGNGAIAAKDNAICTAVKIADDTWLLQVPPWSEPRVTVRNDGEAEVTAQLSLEVGGFFLMDTGKMSAANSGVVSVPFFGNGLDDSIVCWLERGGARIDASDVSAESDVSASATFDVTGCEAGDWTLYVKKGDDEASATLLTLTTKRVGPKWRGEVLHPDTIRSGRAYVGTFTYSNIGDTPTNAPYVRLEAKGDTLIRLSEADAWSKSIELIAASDTAPASVSKPGDSSTVTFLYKTTGARSEIDLSCAFSSPSNVPWAELQTEMRPSWASDELWSFAFDTLRANFGETWDSYLARMRADCDHLLRIGSPVKRMDRLMQLEINEALGNDMALARLASATDLARSGRGLGISFSRSYLSSLRGRFTKGILGYGWTDNFSTYAELQDTQTLVFHLPSGGSYSFTKVTGSWQPEDARDKTVLKETTSVYVLTYSSGTVQTFAKSNMKTASIRDNQGNELTFTYSGSQLQKVQHSDGQFLAFTYSGGKLTKATDDQGRTTSYTYTDDLLASVTAFNGLVTCYEYLSASGNPTDRSLSKITYPDGSTKEFTYDEKGRVASSSVNGGKMKTQIVRGDFGCYSIVAPNGSVTEVIVGANGETLKTVNARGETVKQNYTADSLLEATIAPSGKRSKITYNNDGSPIAAMSASGATTAFGYEPDFDNLASVTDAKGHALNYSYDELGRSKAVSYVDGSSSTLEYNEKGDVVRSTNRRGETIEYEYDAEGNLVKKTWPNGRTFTLAYDVKGNVTNAADSVTGSVTMEYDANERLTRIVYPKGRGFTYAYDALGRVTERTMIGRVASPLAADIQRYTYDSLGRLSTVTDGDNNHYLTNAYDPTTGWLVTQTYGNDTVVSNAYDVLGRTVGIYHLRRDRISAPYQRIAFFEYAYDEDGKCISQNTLEGEEKYTYDADGQLTAVTYPDGTSETFTYDAVGNRITHTGTTGVSPVDEAYTVNNLNQYTSLCDSASLREENFTYDHDGNLTSRTDSSGTTTYYYDTLNRLVAVTNEAKNIRWSCEYDVFGNRVSVTDNGTTTERLFVQGSLPSVAAEYNGDTLAKSHVLVGAVRLATHNSPTPNSPTFYYHSDLLGSARLLTDGTGATKGTRSFKAFGETRTSSDETTDAGYVGTLGVETDTTGLIFMRNRYYNAGMGRFVQMDPIGLGGSDVSLYRYCGNNPQNKIDVDGFSSGLVGGGELVFDVTLGTLSSLGVPSQGTAGLSTSAMLFDLGENLQEGGWLGYALATSDVVKYGLSLNPKYRWLPLAYDLVNLGGQGLAKLVAQVMLPNGGEAKWEKILQDASSAHDPNEITGPLGTGERRYVQQGEWMDYTIYFENKTNATAAAQEVFVDLPMDENLDWTTLELGEIAFGDNIDTSLVGKSHGKSSYALPGTNTSVKTEVTMKDGVLSWYIRDWDPTTTDNFPASATGGFLPPNDPETHCGEGHLSFRVRVKDDAPNGAVINASATIVFDSNAPIETDPSWWNTVGEIHAIEVELDGVATNLTLIAGEPFGELPAPKTTRTGYTFDGWYTGENGTGTKATPDAIVPEGEFSLYENWIGNPYKVRFNANGGEGEMADQSLTYDHVSCLTSNAYTYARHVFVGWAMSETGEVVFEDGAEVLNISATAGAVVNLYAVWADAAPTAEFAEDELCVDEGKAVSVKVLGGNAKQASSVKVYLTYQTASAADINLKSGAYVDGKKVKKMSFPYALSWAKGEVGERTIKIKTKSDKLVEGDEVLTLQLADAVGMELGDARVCTVTVRDTTVATVPSGATAVKDGSGVVVGYWTKKDKKGNVTAYALPGYTLLGWYDAKGKKISAKATITDKDRKAKKLTPKYKAAYLLRALADLPYGGTVKGGGVYASGKSATLKAKPAKYFTFDGWYKGRRTRGAAPYGEGDLVTAKESVKVKVTTNVTYFAKFTPYPKVTVEAAKGGTVKGAGSYLAGKQATLTATPKSGYAFTGWYDVDGKLLSLNATYKYKVTADGAVLTARFKKESSLAKPVLTWGGESNLTVGVRYTAKLSVKGEAKVSIMKVAGLPKGLSYKSGKVTGVPTKKGTFTAKVTVALGSNAKKTWTYSVPLRVSALPKYAKGTFTGPGAIDGKAATVTLTVSSAGKVSGKFVLSKNTKAYSFTADSYDGLADGVFHATASLKYGKKTCEVEVAVGKDSDTGAAIAEIAVTYGGKQYGSAVFGE